MGVNNFFFFSDNAHSSELSNVVHGLAQLAQLAQSWCLAVHWPGFEPGTSRSRVRHVTTTSPSHQPSTPILSPQTPDLLNHRRCCHLSNKLKTYCRQLNCRNLQIWNSHGNQAAHGYFRQRSADIPYVVRSTIGFPSNS